MDHALSRRRILKGAASALAAGASTSTAAPPRAPEPVREVLHEFSYHDVRVTGGPLGEHYEHIRRHYLGLDNDCLLKVYRQHVNLPAPGRDMGGWYDANGFVSGHSLGQYISGLARFGASSGDPACHTKARDLVEGFGETLARNPDPYVGPNAEKLWPAYILDKLEIGLIDTYKLSGSGAAARLLPRVIAGAMPYISPVSRDRIGKKDPPYDETYVLPENLFEVADITGDARYRTLAEHYLLDGPFFDPLAAGQDVFPGKHAYSHAICLSSAAKAYLVSGDPKYKAALLNAWEFLEHQRYASGGWGPDELFVTPRRGALYDSLFNTTAHFETPCGSYANTKLARYLLRLTGDARYGDGLERDIFNTVLAVKFPDDNGDYPYYSTYSCAAHKEYYPAKWPCCSGTLAQGVADYPLGIYFHAADRLVVNLYVPSVLRWFVQGQTVTVDQETQFPDGETTIIRLAMPRPVRLALSLRIPGWIAAAPRILVNGTPQTVTATPATFTTIERVWQDGDQIKLTLPQSLHHAPIDELHPGTVAVLKGPVMLVGVDAAGGSRPSGIAMPAGWAPLCSKQDGAPNHSDRMLVPFYLVRNESYDTYFEAG